jgi:hypothetical protein
MKVTCSSLGRIPKNGQNSSTSENQYPQALGLTLMSTGSGSNIPLPVPFICLNAYMGTIYNFNYFRILANFYGSEIKYFLSNLLKA